VRNDSTLLLLGHFYHGISRYNLGEFTAARALFEQCHTLRDPVIRNTISKLTAEDAYTVMLGYSSSVLTYLGYFDQARSRAEEALLEARRLRHAHTLVYCLWFKCWVISFAATGDAHHAVRTYADEIYDLSNEHGFPLWSAYATFLRGMNSAAVGQARQGLAMMALALDRARAMGATITFSRFLAGIAEALFMLGERGESLSKLHEATEFIQRTDEWYFQAEVHRLQGDVLSATGDKAAAESSYQQALAAAVR
jgi:tetratricopeptide (TPR) repeat protein